jgi:monoamine oxidase
MARTPLFGSLRRALELARAARATGTPIDELMARAAEARRAGRSRREFLRFAAGGAAALAAAPLLSACGGDDDGGDNNEDACSDIDAGADAGSDGGGSTARVAVVGAGLAGLHCAYRLQQAGIDVSVFEASGRTGGRTFTARGMLPDDQIAELGGEFIDSGHECMITLAKELGFELDDLLGKGSIVGDTYFFSGREFSEKEVVADFIPVAEQMEIAFTAGKETEEAFAELDNISIAEWLDDADGGNAAPLIRDLLNVAYTIEYGLDSDVQSVWNLLYLIDFDTPDPFRIFGDSDERFHLHLGSDSLAGKLAESLASQIQVDSPLVALARDGSRYKLTFGRDSSTKEDSFDHVVLALPFSTLRDVDLKAAELPQEKLDVINQVNYGTNCKLMGSFTNRVWNLLDPAKSGSSYSDLGYQATWDSSRGQDGKSGVLTNYLGGAAGVAAGRGKPQERLLEALEDIDRVFPGVAKAYAKNSALRFHWPTAPFNKGSYTCYTTGQWAFYGLEGERVDNIHFCGEHTSLDFQGYMEGACETGASAAVAVMEDLGLTAGPQLRRYLVGARPAGLRGRRLLASRRFRRGGRRRIAR